MTCQLSSSDTSSVTASGPTGMPACFATFSISAGMLRGKRALHAVNGVSLQLRRGDVVGLFDPEVEVRDGNLSAAGEEPSVTSTGVGESVSARATLTVPFLGIGVKGLDYEVTRYTVMPRTD